MIAARPLTPSPLRSNGSSRSRRVSSGMASTSPAPNTGIGTRRANTFASTGTMGWHAWPGTENKWKRVSPVPSSVSNSPRSLTRPARTSETVLVPPMTGTLWQTAQLVPLNAGPRPSSVASTSRKSSSPIRNSSNSAGVMPASGPPGTAAPHLGNGQRGAEGRKRDGEEIPDGHGVSLFSDQRAAHERMACPAQLGAFED